MELYLLKNEMTVLQMKYKCKKGASIDFNFPTDFQTAAAVSYCTGILLLLTLTLKMSVTNN